MKFTTARSIKNTIMFYFYFIYTLDLCKLASSHLHMFRLVNKSYLTHLFAFISHTNSFIDRSTPSINLCCSEENPTRKRQRFVRDTISLTNHLTDDFTDDLTDNLTDVNHDGYCVMCTHCNVFLQVILHYCLLDKILHSEEMFTILFIFNPVFVYGRTESSRVENSVAHCYK